MLLVALCVRMAGRPGVLEVGAEGGVGQPCAAVELVVFQLGEYAKALGVAFEIEKVAAFGIAHRIQPAASGGLLKPVANGVFAGVAEWRVADIVGQAGGLHHHAQIARRAPVRQFVTQHLADAHGQRTADAADFQGVGQAGVDMVVARHRMHLGLASQAAEGTGEDDAVMILVKGAAAELCRAGRGFAETFTGEQGVPIQGLSSPG